MNKTTASIILTCLLAVVCIILFMCGGNEDLPSDNTLAPDSTVSPSEGVSPETTIPPETTASPDTLNTPETTAEPETTAPPAIDMIPDVTLWDKETHELTDLLSMKVDDIKVKYGTLTLVESESRAGLSVYSMEKLNGVLLIFENRDRTSPLHYLLTPDKIKLTTEYAGEIAGLEIGKSGEGSLWNDAICIDSPITRLIGESYIINATYEETDDTFPDGYPTDSNKLAAWREAFCKAPVGKIVDITLEKKKEILPGGELWVISNLYNTSVHEVAIKLKTENARYSVFDYDDRYVVYAVQNIGTEISIQSSFTLEIFVIDTLEGKIVSSLQRNAVESELEKLRGTPIGTFNDYRIQLLHTENAAELALVTWSGERIMSFDIIVSDAEVKITEKDSVMPYARRERHTSPDGKYTVFNVIEDLDDGQNGGIDLVMSDGTFKRIYENNTPERVQKYTVVGFVDNTTFAYSIWSYERSEGYGTYNIETGEKTEYLGKDRMLIGAGDGYLYIRELELVDGPELPRFLALCSIDSAGKKTRLASTTVFTLENGKRVYISDVKDGEIDLTNIVPSFEGLGWMVYDDTLNFYSADFSKLLVSIDPPSDNTHLDANVHVYNRVITVVTPRYKG